MAVDRVVDWVLNDARHYFLPSSESCLTLIRPKGVECVMGLLWIIVANRFQRVGWCLNYVI